MGLLPCRLAEKTDRGEIDVSIVIVNYNTKDLLSNCLDSIRAETTDLIYEVIVVDNASTDGSRMHIKKHYPEVALIESDENLGFGRANNLGAARANGQYIFFLNSDTRLLNNALKQLLDYARAHDGERLGVIGALLLKPSLENANSFGTFPRLRDMLSYRWRMVFFLRDAMRDLNESISFDVDFVTGADMFMRRDVFVRAGGFDPRFFMYYEETDLQKRLHELGFHNRIIPGPRIIHLEGGGKTSMRARLNNERSMYMYFAKHLRSRLSLFYFYIAYSLTGILSIPKYSARENMRYFRAVLLEMPVAILGNQGRSARSGRVAS